MKRTFLAKRNALLSRETFSPGLAALAFALVALLLRLAAPDAFYGAVAPALRLGDTMAAGSRAFVEGIGDAALLARRNEELVSQNRALLSENAALADKLAALEALVLGAAGSRASQLGVMAGVLARPPQSPYDTLIVAAGREDGVSAGMEAFGPGGVPLGVVTLAAQRFAQVTLFSAPGQVSGGWIGKAKLPLTITGEGGGVLAASVPLSAVVAEGDIVYLPGPGALPAGSVVRVDSDPSSPSLRLQIAPAANLFSLTWVLIRDVGLVDFSVATASPAL